MLAPNLLIIYVTDPLKSAAFYEKIFERKSVTAFPTYVAFAFENGLSVALWSLTAKDFVSSGSGNRSELAFMVPDALEVERLHSLWSGVGVHIEQGLFEAVFGLTFVALDPDGHRIRVCIPDK